MRVAPENSGNGKYGLEGGVWFAFFPPVIRVEKESGDEAPHSKDLFWSAGTRHRFLLQCELPPKIAGTASTGWKGAFGLRFSHRSSALKKKAAMKRRTPKAFFGVRGLVTAFFCN